MQRVITSWARWAGWLLVGCVCAAACGPSTLAIKTAKTATYTATPAEVFALAKDAAQADYKLGAVDEQRFQLSTEPRFYSGTGDLESPGAGGAIHMDPGSVQVIFIVQVVPSGEHQVVVRVIPKTFQLVQGSPKPRELAADDPGLPPFILGRADALSYRIYELGQRYTH